MASVAPSASVATSAPPVPYKEHGTRCVPVITQDNDCPVVVAAGTPDEQVAALGRWLLARKPGWTWRVFDDAAEVDAAMNFLVAPAKGKLTKAQDAWLDAHYVAWVYRGFSPTLHRDAGKVEFRRDNPATQKRTPPVEF